jgi:hypothetical protein
VVFALIPVGVLPITFALPLIGLVLACGASPDGTPGARPVARSRRNVVLASLMLLAYAVVALQPQLLPTLVDWFGVDGQGLVVTLLAVSVLTLPLAMTESSTPVDEQPAEQVLVLTRRNLMLALTVLVTVTIWHTAVGMSFLVLGILVLGLPVLLAFSRVRQARRGRVLPGMWRNPLTRGSGPHRVQVLNVLLCCALLGAVMVPGTYDVLRLDLSAGGYRAFTVAYLACLVALVLLTVVPLRRVHVGSNLLVAAGSVFLAVQLVAIYLPARQPVTVASPTRGEWYVGQGGHAELVNYHHVTSTQRDALDLLQVVDGHTHPAGSTDLDDYYIYGQPLLAPADGVVASVRDGLPDQPIGSVDHEHHAGNYVVIDIGGGRYLMIGHLQQNTVRVAAGDAVAAGQVIARVGNSGNTDQPHIHIQAQNVGSFDDTTDDPGELLRTVRTYPLLFEGVVLTRDGTASTPSAVDPRRGDLVRPVTAGAEAPSS